MSPTRFLPLLVAGLVVSLAACSGTTATPTAPPTAAPTPAATPAAATPSPAQSPTAAPSPSPSAAAASPNDLDAYPLLAGFEGQFTGSWTNTTFGSTGPMTWRISANPSDRTVQIIVNVGGNFFGGSGAPPETILLTHLATGVIAGHSPAFGDISGTIMPTGALHISLSNVLGGIVSKVEITGSFTGTDTIAIDYTATMVAGGTAAGKVTLRRAVA